MKCDSQTQLVVSPAIRALDFSAIAAALRVEDAHEITVASGGVSIDTRLRENVELSTISYIATEGDQPVMLGGIAVRENFAGIWAAVGTPLVSRQFLKFKPAVDDPCTKIDAVAGDQDEGLALGEEEGKLRPSIGVWEIG